MLREKHHCWQQYILWAERKYFYPWISNGGTNFILRIKEQETLLILQEHDDDDGDDGDDDDDDAEVITTKVWRSDIHIRCVT